MVPNPEDLMKVTGFTGDSSDDELSRVNLVKVVDGLTEAPGRSVLIPYYNFSGKVQFIKPYNTELRKVLRFGQRYVKSL